MHKIIEINIRLLSIFISDPDLLLISLMPNKCQNPLIDI